MEIIAQFIENLKSLENNVFLINTHLEPLLINQYVPNKLKNLISNPEITELMNSLSCSINSLNKLLAPVSEQAKVYSKKKYPQKQEPYANFKIDGPPIVKDNSNKNVQLSFEDIIASSNKEIKPINRRKELNYKGVCPCCGAPNNYIYDNNKGKQYLCKVCNNTFSIHPRYHEEITYHCPHCSYKLLLKHERHDYDVLTCHNDDCPFYLKNKNLLENRQAEHLKVNVIFYKLRYNFRLFDFDLGDIKHNTPFLINSKIDLAKIRHSQFALGLALTYYVNYGLSSRKTSLIMKEIHGINISHQTVANYAEAAASHMDYLNEHYKYNLSSVLAMDETYIKVKGRTSYVFFASDPINKIITSSRIFGNRSTKNAITTIYGSIKKYKEIPNDLTIITDGNPIYNAAQVFFSLNDIKFDLHQVIGLTNKDTTSTLYRPYKQAEERLNRTYKQNYYGTNGYGSLRNANVYMALYVSFFNFLRLHSSLDYKTPVSIAEVDNQELMPYKWLALIKYSNDFILAA